MPIFPKTTRFFVSLRQYTTSGKHIVVINEYLIVTTFNIKYLAEQVYQVMG